MEREGSAKNQIRQKDRIPSKRRRVSLPRTNLPSISSEFMDDRLFHIAEIETNIDYDVMLSEPYSNCPDENMSLNDTMHNIPELDADLSWSPLPRSKDTENYQCYEEINEVLDTSLLVKAAFETAVNEENAPEAGVIAEDLVLLERAKMDDTLIQTYNRIDDGILATLENNFLADADAYKTKHKFPQSFADEDTAAATFDSHFLKRDSLIDCEVNVFDHVESSIRPTTKCFAPLDESIMRNTYYDHSAGYKDYDKLAKKKRKPDFLFNGLVPRSVFRYTTSTFEPSQKDEVDLKKLILEFKEFLAHPDNIPWQLNSDYTIDTKVENDEWDVKHLEEINNLRNLFLNDQRNSEEDDDEIRFLFQSLTMKLKLDPEGIYSQIKDDDESGISFLNGAAPLDPNKLNPYSNYPSLEKYTVPSIVPRETCTATLSSHPCRKPLSPKLITTPEVKEVKSGLPFDLKSPRLPYECPRGVQEYTNHLVIRVALNRYISNNDDSFAHLILYKLLDARPDTFYAQEAFRIFNQPARSMTHKEIQTLAKIASDYQCFDASLHYLLVMDYFREKNYIGMEEEISNWCYSMRYAGMNKFYHPFPETSESEKSTFKENNENVFSGERKAVLLTSSLYILTFNYQKSRRILKQLQAADYEALEDEDILHWIYTIDAQSQIGLINPYAQHPKTFFEKSSDFFSLATFEIMHDIASLIDYFQTRLENSKDGDAAIPEIVKESTCRFLMMQYIYLQHHTLSAKEKDVKEIHEVFDTLCSVPFHEGKTRKLERLAKTLMRSYYLSIGRKGFGPQLSLLPEPQLIRDPREGHCVEGTIVENIVNAYELAYSGKFDDALKIIDKLEIANVNGIVGCHNTIIAKSCIEFDKSFFKNSRNISELKLLTLYEKCPLEALFRDVTFQILYGDIDPLIIRKVYQVLGHSKSIEVLPTIQLRCRMALAQIFIECEKYRNAIDELTNALELSTKLNLLLFVSMIQRRLAIVYILMDNLSGAYKAIENCKAVQINVEVPSLEAGMIYLTKYLIYSKSNKLQNVKEIRILPNYVLSEYLMKAAKLLKPFTLVYKWLLVEEFNFMISINSSSESAKDFTVKKEDTFLHQHKEDFMERFSKQFDLNDFCLGAATSDLTKMLSDYKRKYSLPLYLI